MDKGMIHASGTLAGNNARVLDATQKDIKFKT
jgi:hypothetical protein